MKTPQTLFALAATLILTAPAAFAADVSASTKTEYKQDEDGGYESKKTVEKKDTEGTKTKQQMAVSVEQDDDGNYKKTVEHQTTVDPEGLMNKSTTKTTETTTADDGKTEYKHKKVVDGETVEEESTVEEKE